LGIINNGDKGSNALYLIMTERKEVLKSETHKIKIVGQISFTIYMTVSIDDNKPYEIFLNTKDATMVEHLIAVTVLVSKMLQSGIKVEVISKELLTIASPFTGHMKKGGWCKSLYARIGEVLDLYKDDEDEDKLAQKDN